ncbi:MAG: Stealth CR1 domain-containing protein [Heliobacteriaceae bacterium]|jgi:hypothetical protein|nr:Stealth CR1 domain-containing protein [Heliobacteriaceae bacterium]
MENDYNVDLVYLWVDGSDMAWQAKKNIEQAQHTQLAPDAAAKGRFCDNNELKYSLRSVEKFAPWINKIFIVTDNQIPAWLNINHPRIKIVDHTEIMPACALPCFNSTALETRIPYIEGLSERFLYANDDMFFANKTEKSFFFDKSGMPIIRFQKKILKETYNLYTCMVKNAQDKILEEYGLKMRNFLHHNVDAYLKSDYMECLNKFKTDFERTMMSKFRDKDNIERSVISYYALALKHACAKVVHRNIFSYSDSTYIFPQKIASCGKKLKKIKPKLFCINDDETTTDEQRQQIKEFLESYFSARSQFEV